MAEIQKKLIRCWLVGLVGCAALPASSAVVNFDDLDSLTPSPFVTAIGSFATLNDTTTAALDRKDVTFRFNADFNAFDGGSPEVLFETGGATSGSSLVYAAGNVLQLRLRDSSSTMLASHTLTAPQLAAGVVEVIVTYDFDNTSDTVISLYLDRAQVATATGTVDDYAGSDASGFGTFGSATGAIGAGTTPFTSGTIVVSSTPGSEAGLEIYRDTLAIPEPGALGLCAMGAALMLRRRGA